MNIIEEQELPIGEIQEDEEVVAIPKEERRLITQAYDKSISDLVRMIADSDIDLTPDFQREYVWDNKKASLLVESILINVPIPIVYAAEEQNDTWTIVDGLQRLNSLKRFFDNEFKLNGLEVLTELNKLDYKSLDSQYTRMLRNGLIRVVVISKESHPEIKYDVFMRINRGSIRLAEQELRNCLYKGAFNEALKKEIRYNKEFLGLLNLKDVHKRFADCELILRFLAIHQQWDNETKSIRNYKGSMKTFINNFMRANQNIGLDKIAEYKALFDETIAKVYKVLGNKAFSKMNENKEYDPTLNRALMDCIMLALSLYEEDKLLANKDEIANIIYSLIWDKENLEFLESITNSTTSTQKINFRIAKFLSEIKDLFND